MCNALAYLVGYKADFKTQIQKWNRQLGTISTLNNKSS